LNPSARISEYWREFWGERERERERERESVCVCVFGWGKMGKGDDVAEAAGVGKEHHLKGGRGFRNPWPSFGFVPSFGEIISLLLVSLMSFHPKNKPSIHTFFLLSWYVFLYGSSNIL
jgi:hypothetical protein